MNGSGESLKTSLKVRKGDFTLKFKIILIIVGKTPGDAGPIPKMSNLIEKSKSRSSLDFWVWPKTVARDDGIEMRRMIQLIDDTIRKKKAGTVTGKTLLRSITDTVLNENSFSITPHKYDSYHPQKQKIFQKSEIRVLEQNSGVWKSRVFAAQRKAENDFEAKQKKIKEEDPTAEGLFDERLGTVPFDLIRVMIKDNRNSLESILGGYSKGKRTFNYIKGHRNFFQ